MSEPEQDGSAGAALPRLPCRRWRGLAVAGVAATIGIVAIAGLSRPAAESARYAIAESGRAAPERSQDPLQAELVRCRTLPANTDDASCRAAWEVNRRRFFGESRSLISQPRPPVPAPVEVAPGVPATDSILSKEER